MSSEARSNEGIEVLVHASGQVQAVQLRRAAPQSEPVQRESPGPARRHVHWVEWLVSVLVFALAGWFAVDSLHTLLALPGWIPLVALAVLAVAVFLWFRWPAWSLRFRLLGAVLVLLAVGTPIAAHFAQ